MKSFIERLPLQYRMGCTGRVDWHAICCLEPITVFVTSVDKLATLEHGRVDSSTARLSNLSRHVPLRMALPFLPPPVLIPLPLCCCSTSASITSPRLCSQMSSCYVFPRFMSRRCYPRDCG